MTVKTYKRDTQHWLVSLPSASAKLVPHTRSDSSEYELGNGNIFAS